MSETAAPGDGAPPRYDDLPVIEALGLPHSWGVFGDGDDRGTVNNMAPDTIVAATSQVSEGRVFRLDLPLDVPDPPLFDRAPIAHTMTATSRHTWDDQLDGFNTQGSTQWDSLRHVRCREFGFYGGITDDPTAHDRLGIDAWARTGIIGRGVLADVDSYLRARGEVVDPTTPRAISAAELDDVLRVQGVQLRRGDVLCLRTGWMAGYLEASRAGDDRAYRNGSFVGLAADDDVARYLWDAQIVAIAADNPAVEAAPQPPETVALHRRLIPLLGFAIGELFALDELAAHCAARAQWTFLFVAAPLHLRGGIGSPGNALAIC
jgi:kynurenine formamidase